MSMGGGTVQAGKPQPASVLTWTPLLGQDVLHAHEFSSPPPLLRGFECTPGDGSIVLGLIDITDPVESSRRRQSKRHWDPYRRGTGICACVHACACTLACLRACMHAGHARTHAHSVPAGGQVGRWAGGQAGRHRVGWAGGRGRRRKRRCGDWR